MIHGIFTHLTAVTVLAHALLGCCWHHAHDGECCATEPSDSAEATPLPPMCACGLHRVAAAENETRPGDLGGDDTPQPIPAQPCSHGRCTYLGADDVRVRDGAVVSLTVVDQQALIDQITRSECRQALPADVANGGIGGRTARICFQVWLT